MPDLGIKYECTECGTKFYDLGKPDPVCPKCGTNQRERTDQKASPATAKARAQEPVLEDDDELNGELPEEEETLLDEDDEEDEDEDEDEDEEA